MAEPTPGRPGEAWLVALDVDGTLVNHHGELSDRVRDAVAAVRKNGHHIVVSTGRAILSTTHVLTQIDQVDGHVVCSNGAVTVRLDPDLASGWELDRVVTFDARPVVELVRAELPDALFAVEVAGQGVQVSGEWPAGELSGDVAVVGFDRLFDAGPTTRVVVRSPAHTPEHFIELVERLGLHGVSYAVGYTAWLDLAPEGVSKASALEELRPALGVDPAHTVAIGDGRNDIEMLTWAAHGVAMGDAPPEVLAVADHVTGTVAQDGVADALERIAALGG